MVEKVRAIVIYVTKVVFVMAQVENRYLGNVRLAIIVKEGPIFLLLIMDHLVDSVPEDTIVKKERSVLSLAKLVS